MMALSSIPGGGQGVLSLLPFFQTASDQRYHGLFLAEVKRPEFEVGF